MALRRLRVKAPGGSYSIAIGSRAREKVLGQLVGRKKPSRVHLVTDTRVHRHHGKRVLKVLRQADCPVGVTVVPAGEKSKSASQLARLWRELIHAGCDRQSCIVALGGGVVGDLAGFH